MITATDNSWRYYGPPRTGSTLLHRVLQRPPMNGIYSGQQHDFEYLPGARLVISVRNPYTRMVSLWKHRRYDLGRESVIPGEDPAPVSEAEYPYRQFLEELCILPPFFSTPITGWITQLGEEADPKLILIRQERLWDDTVRAWPELRNRHPPTDRPNGSAMAICEQPPYADVRCIRMVRETQEADFNRFGYHMDVPIELRT